MRRLFRELPSMFVVLLAASCSKSSGTSDSALAPAASALAVSKTDSPTTAWHYVIDPKSTTHVDMP
ncbi:MAG TPA: hypothetical protein VII82_04505, partial [Polyangiaceae bacterium]